jgi:3-hydroxymyristoyl/3-hydroxydecanoyl-(acyl carrier protein) dehydratase
MSEAPAPQSDAADYSDPVELLHLARRLRREPIWKAGPDTRSVSLQRDAIERLIEHRDPFLLVDRITQVDPTQGALEGIRVVDPEDPVFRGHFPGDPIYPGCLQIEMVGQLCLCCHHFQSESTYDVPRESKPRRLRGVQVHSASFLRGIAPGDEVTIRALLLASDTLAMTCAGQLLRGDAICAVAVMEAYFVD